MNPHEGMDLSLPPLDNVFAGLGDVFSAGVTPSPVNNPRLLHANTALMRSLGLPSGLEQDPRFVAIMAGNALLPGGNSRASLYAGHQFGSWVPQLGDGRAILLGQLRTPDGGLWDLQLKGAGQTPFSRFADGRAVLRSSIREYLASEALHGLGIPTTRALTLIAADDPVQRETVERAAVICRAAPSHIRFGNFEVFYDRQQFDALRTLADHVIQHYFPEVQDRGSRYAAWLGIVVEHTAQLIAQWQAVGFCHGVMNTDNMSILGLTLDYGPYGFIDGFDAGHICNHSDHGGRYAYDQQPVVGHWNCSRLVQACLPLLADDADAAVEIGQAIVDQYPTVYADAMLFRWRQKFGLNDAGTDDSQLVNRFLTLLHQTRADFTASFRALCMLGAQEDGEKALIQRVGDSAALRSWLSDYRARLGQERETPQHRASRMRQANPRYVLRNHLAQAAIAEAERGGNALLTQLFQVLQQPYDDQPEHAELAEPPGADTPMVSVSCSS